MRFWAAREERAGRAQQRRGCQQEEKREERGVEGGEEVEREMPAGGEAEEKKAQEAKEAKDELRVAVARIAHEEGSRPVPAAAVPWTPPPKVETQH